MCIIDGNIDNVSKTKIFVGQDWTGNQITVYSNKVETKQQVAMILPCPKGNIKLYDMSDHKNFFEKLNNFFPQMQYKGFNAQSTNSSFGIVQVGSYDVSIVPSLEEMDNLNYIHFNLSPGVKYLLNKDYSEGFSFIVCMIRQGAEFHPIAYTHKMKDTYFIPTKHYHNGSEKHADWDHEIYVMSVNDNLSKYHNYGIKDVKNIKPLNFNEVLNNPSVLPFTIYTCRYLDKLKIDKFYNKNLDIIVKA